MAILVLKPNVSLKNSVFVDISTGEEYPVADPSSPILITFQKAKLAFYNNWLIEKKFYKGSTDQYFLSFIKKYTKEYIDLLNEKLLCDKLKNENYRINYFGILERTTDSNNNPEQTAKVDNTASIKPVENKVPVTTNTNNLSNSKDILHLLYPDREVKSIPSYNSSNSDIIRFIQTCYQYKPKYLQMTETKWKLLIRSIIRGENVLIVGDRGEGKTASVIAASNTLNRPLFKINFGNMQDAQTALIGKTHFDVSKGTVFARSYFVEAITTPNAIVLLDEFTRASDDAMNILFSVLDPVQRYLRLNDEINTSKIDVAPGVSFVATANIGYQYTGTRTLDSALRDRFSVKIEVDTLKAKSRNKILKSVYPNLNSKIIEQITTIADKINEKVYGENSLLTVPISTRTCLNLAALINDGFSLIDSIECTVYPEYSNDGGNGSERVFVKQIVQGVIG